MLWLHSYVITLRYYITWPLVTHTPVSGLVRHTMSHIDSVNQEVCAQLLYLCYSVNILHRLPTYVHSTFTLRKLLFGCYYIIGVRIRAYLSTLYRAMRFRGQCLLGWVCRNMWWYFEGSGILRRGEISRKYGSHALQGVIPTVVNLYYYLMTISLQKNNDDKLIISLKVASESSIEIFVTKTKLCMSAQQCMCQTNYCITSNLTDTRKIITVLPLI